MPTLSKTVKIPHRPDQVFDLVADISRYPDFIKWIRSMKVTEQPSRDGVRNYRGEADVGFKGFSERFATDVTADAESGTIRVELAHGPFKRLKNQWTIKGDDQQEALIDFYIDYEFRNPVLALLAKANTDLAVSRVMKAFKDEADRRYGASRI